ncbi:tetratricopeptide repeat protein [Shewanella sp. D64]|uniref:tetratricopeptide repeat protein n=1 Tax=unclassified Shewanella TaxID=196818 RepID=UPI0022BA5303|nr:MULTISPECIES: tetratricopeptide repeat protein [unclassified Shewanella]MEC4728010.1 tetratricopeptide repeat protein [Shewanella sp. D64]MEC4740145.1 tetratricopeptide repeat protein [Shewanella sp. E94]WBJ95205.1 tetratricopeptide repeat protein [Shewanella sp. MTB7]
MNTLLISISIILFCSLACLFCHHLKYGTKIQCVEKDVGHFFGSNINIKSNHVNSSNNYYFGFIGLFFISVSVLLYVTIGSYQNLDSAKVDYNIDYLLVADINKGQKLASEHPDDPQVLLGLAQSYIDGGLYSDALGTLDNLLTINKENSEALGLKATSMYYRDTRVINMDTSLVIARALTLHHEEFNTRLLIANDAYLKGDYQKAINNWNIILTNKLQVFNRDAIQFAIEKAKLKLTKGDPVVTN